MNFSIRITGTEQPDDPWLMHSRLALVCEGGGQRGIFTAGILDAFMEQDFFPFRTMIGVSAGAQNLSAYACAAQGYARHAITRYSTSKLFFDPLRFARGGHLVDLDWYFDSMQRDKPLDLLRGQRRLSGRALYLCASRSDTLRADYLPFQASNWLQVAKASSAIPVFYRGGVSLNGVNYWDGGVADALPVQAAHARGGDCIVVIRTMPAEPTTKPLKLPQRLIHGRLQEMVSVMESHQLSYRMAQAFIDHPPQSVKVIELAPSKALASRLLGSRPDALRQDYRIGRACGHYFLDRYAWRLRRQSVP